MIRVSQRLRDARIQKGLSLAEVANATKIRPSFLSSIEKGEYARLPSPMYAEGFIKSYATYLGLPIQETLALFHREFSVKSETTVLPESMARRRSVQIRPYRIPTAVWAISGIVLLVGSFLFYQYRAAFFPPNLTISSPHDNTAVSSDVTVTGKTDATATVTVNGFQAALDDSGNFTKHIILFPGPGIIQVSAKNKFGKETVVERKVMVK